MLVHTVIIGLKGLNSVLRNPSFQTECNHDHIKM